jgi:DNA mismatch endonuclease, patch repair protein
VSRNMAAIRGRNNRTELALRKELHRRGHRYRLYVTGIVGTPDIVFVRERTVVFIDGDYWHGRVLKEGGPSAFDQRFKTERREWWRTKLLRTIDRDQRTTLQLVADGWTVIRLWESEVKSDVRRAAAVVERVLRRKRRQGARRVRPRTGR